MDERRLKYLYATLAVAFGLPSLVVGGAAATMLLLTGLGQFGHGTLAAVTVTINSSPRQSVAMCLLRPLVFLPASYPELVAATVRAR